MSGVGRWLRFGATIVGPDIYRIMPSETEVVLQISSCGLYGIYLGLLLPLEQQLMTKKS